MRDLRQSPHSLLDVHIRRFRCWITRSLFENLEIFFAFLLIKGVVLPSNFSESFIETRIALQEQRPSEPLKGAEKSST